MNEVCMNMKLLSSSTGSFVEIVCMLSFYTFHLVRVLEQNKQNCYEKYKDIGLLVCVMVYTVD